MLEQHQTAVDSIHVTVESSHETENFIQDTIKSSQDNEVFTQYENCKVGLILKVELENLKLQVVRKIKDPYNN